MQNSQNKKPLNPYEIELQTVINENSQKTKTIARLNAQIYTLASKVSRLEAENKKLKPKSKAKGKSAK